MLEGMRLWEEEPIIPWPAPVCWDGAWAWSRDQKEETGESGRPSLEPPRTVEPPSSEALISGEGISAGQFGSGVESSERIPSTSDEKSSCRFEGSGLGSSGRRRSEPGLPASSAGLMPRLGS